MDSGSSESFFNTLRNCFERTSFDSGHSRLPEPPDSKMICMVLIPLQPLFPEKSEAYPVLSTEFSISSMKSFYLCMKYPCYHLQ